MRRALVPVAALALFAAAAVPAATDFRPTRHGNPPLLVDHSWPRRAVRLMAFVPRSYPDWSSLTNFARSIPNSFWWKDASAAFGLPQTMVEPVGMVQVVDDMPKLTSSSSAVTYQRWVDDRIDRLGYSRDEDGYLTVFVLFIPCQAPQSLDGFGCVSHHPSTSVDDSLATVTTDPNASTDAKTTAASHEIAEAATKGWYLDTQHTTTPWVDASPWVEDEGSGHIEAADMAQGDRSYEQGNPIDPSGTRPVYAYSRVYSNAASRQLGDPAVPPAPYPYYDVYATGSSNGWYHTTPGAVAVVHLRGWSTANFGKWKVSASVVGGRTGPGRNSTCKLGKSSWTGIGNGTRSTLSLVTSSRSPTPSWCVVKLESSLPSSSPFANHADAYHVWFIGFIVKD